MINSTTLIINHILKFGNYRSSEIPRKYLRELLIAVSELKKKDIVLIPQFIKRAKRTSGKLIIDDTNHPKYGLKKYARKLKNLKTSGYEDGFKIVFFLWESSGHRIPLGFALWHKHSKSINDLVLAGISRLRNEFKLKPKVVLADGFYSVDKIVKLITDYGWALVFRFRCNRKLDDVQIKKLIPRGYGEKSGYLKNKSKVKIFRRKNRFYETNRMLMTVKDMVALYKQRWTIEETFRVLKVCIGINRCQQHSVKFQELYIYCCLLAFYCLERLKTSTIYKLKQTVNFQSVCFDNSILTEVFNQC